MKRAEDWRWGSLWRARYGAADHPPRIDEWPLQRPGDWTEYVNQTEGTTVETDALRRCTRRGTPYGDEAWVSGVADQLGLRSTLRPRGRPAKQANEGGPDPFP